MDWYQTLFEVIDMRSFSNLWFWIALAVTWSSVSHFVLGVPFDLLQRARRQGGSVDRDFEDMVRINVNRLNYISGVAGVWLVVFVSGMLTALGILGFWYDVEFAQAVFLLAFPLTIVGILRMRIAQQVKANGITGEALKRRLIRHRLATQVVGMLAVVITVFWGMYKNFDVGVFGGF